ncbi:MAG: hypothetical protein EBV05_05395 [Cyanobacteria bacterium WB6_1B_304]|jgi:hypothetical protein|nr:hypothetical protein [Cyanobacteria bacterium WB6_1B_304]
MAIAPNGERSKGKDPILLKSPHLSLTRIDKSGIKVSPSLPWANIHGDSSYLPSVEITQYWLS